MGDALLTHGGVGVCIKHGCQALLMPLVHLMIDSVLHGVTP
jgi:hypothetical protein